MAALNTTVAPTTAEWRDQCSGSPWQQWRHGMQSIARTHTHTPIHTHTHTRRTHYHHQTSLYYHHQNTPTSPLSTGDSSDTPSPPPPTPTYPPSSPPGDPPPLPPTHQPPPSPSPPPLCLNSSHLHPYTFIPDLPLMNLHSSACTIPPPPLPLPSHTLHPSHTPVVHLQEQHDDLRGTGPYRPHCSVTSVTVSVVLAVGGCTRMLLEPVRVLETAADALRHIRAVRCI